MNEMTVLTVGSSTRARTHRFSLADDEPDRRRRRRRRRRSRPARRTTRPTTAAAAIAARRMTSAVASLSRLSPSSTATMRRETPRRLTIGGRDGVGRADDRAERDAQAQAEAGDQPRRRTAPSSTRADSDQHDRQPADGRELAPEVHRRHRDRGRVQQRRQHDREDPVRLDLDRRDERQEAHADAEQHEQQRRRNPNRGPRMAAAAIASKPRTMISEKSIAPLLPGNRLGTRPAVTRQGRPRIVEVGADRLVPIAEPLRKPNPASTSVPTIRLRR